MDVGTRAVHIGLCTLRAHALSIAIYAHGHQADVLAKYANTIPLSNQSLFRGGLNAVVAKATSAAQDYSTWQKASCKMDHTTPNPPGVKRATRELLRVLYHPNVSPFRAGTTGPLPPRPVHEHGPRVDFKSSMGRKSSVGQKP